jgi:hypothetical protein
MSAIFIFFNGHHFSFNSFENYVQIVSLRIACTNGQRSTNNQEKIQSAFVADTSCLVLLLLFVNKRRMRMRRKQVLC